MPLYSDPGYFYSTGSYNPYYSSNPYASYGTYSRGLAGSYVVPTSRTTNIISSSRYKPKLSTISELPYSARGLTTPLTRIRSPKFSYKSPPKYIPPRPIPISTADIDVSASRRPRHEHYTPLPLPVAPTSTGTSDRSETNSVDYMPRIDGNDPPGNRSTIKRDRAVVRLSIMHRKSPKEKQRSPEIKETSSKSSPKTQSSWRDNFRDELQPKPRDFTRKTPGELLLERHIIRDKNNQESPEAKFVDLSKAVAAETDPVAQMETLRRLSQAQCPTFHDICEDISSDKIDDDLNAGTLRRRASLIQEQEMEILNEIQKSGSDIFQYILERQESQDDCRKSMKRKSKRGRKVRHKITATVAIDESPPPTPVTPTSADSMKTETPKIFFNLDNVEESCAVQNVVLPKKKKIDKVKTEKTDAPIIEDLSKMSDEDLESEEEKSEEKPVKLPKLIIKSDSVVNVTLQINSKPKKVENEKLKEISTPDKDLTEEIVQKDDISSAQPEKSLKEVLPEKRSEPSTPLKYKTKKDVEVGKTEANKKIIEQSNLSAKHRNNKGTKLDTKLTTETKNENKARDKFANLKSMFQGGKEDKPAKLKSVKKTPEKLKVLAAEKQQITDKSLANEIKVDSLAIEKPAEKSDSMSNDKQESSKSDVSQNIQVATNATNHTPVSDIIKKVDLTESPSIAKPKPIARLQKSDSGEDFWAQIGTRETLYMDQRRQDTFETSWTKRERFLENEDVQNTNDTDSLQKIKDKLDEIKTESLNEAAALQVSKKPSVRRSVSDASALEKPNIRGRPQKLATSTSTENSENSNRQSKSDLKVKKLAAKPSDELQSIEPKTICDSPSSCDSLMKNEAIDTAELNTSPISRDEKLATNEQSIVLKKSENLTSIDSQMKSIEVPTTASSDITIASGIATAYVSDAESALHPGTKIESGLAAKSPEPKIKKQIDKFAKDSNNNIKITTNDATPKTGKTKDSVANKSKDSDSKSLATKTKSPKEAKSKITPKKNAERPVKCSALIKSGNVDSAEDANGVTIKEKMAASTNLPTLSPSQSPKASAVTIKASEISAGTIGDGGQHDNDRIRTDEIRSEEENQRAPTGPQESSQRSNEQLSASTPMEDIVEKSDVTASFSDTITSDAKHNEVVADKATSAGEEKSTPTNTTTTALITPASGGVDNPAQNASSTSKNRTVAALNRCLLDVDADLSDYYPSDLENITSDEEVNTSECSSCQGSSMKKNAKHNHRHHNRNKKKDKDSKKFDPNKKIKINPTLKCYVKDEPAPYPLYATPRPLWKREKVNYPSSSDSDDSESDSEYSTSSDECSGDELKPSGVTSLGSSDIRMSTCSNDSGFEGGTAPTTPKKMLGAHDTEKSPNHNPAYQIYTNHEDDDLETSFTFAQFQRSGRITAPASVIPRFKKYSVEDFHFLAVLGKGSFGKVLLAELRNTDYCYAVKCLKKDVVLEDDDVECTLIERKVLALGTKHPYLCHLFCTFQTESHLFFVMEYLNGGDLMFHIQQSGRFPEPRARFYAAEIISGLKFLHKKGIIYRDLKLDNVLLDFDGHVRIADFGMCKLQIYLDKTADSFCGTPDYMAPEIIKGDKYNQNVDWWSFGVLLYEMLIGQSPFSGCDEDELFWSICNEIPWFPIYITQEATSILKALLQKDPSIRIGSQYSPAGEIYEHVFFRDIDWDRLERRAIDPPFKPQVKHPLDTKYFDKTFTRERVRLTPIDKDILQSMDQAQFDGFSYTNPNATLD